MLLLLVAFITTYAVVTYAVKEAQYISVSKQKIETLTHVLESDYSDLITSNSSSSSQKVIAKWLLFPSILRAEVEDTLANSVLNFTANNKGESPPAAGEFILLEKPVMQAGKHVGWVRYIVSTNYQEVLWSELQKTMLFSIPFILLLVACLAMYLQRIVLKPLQYLIAKLASIVEKGDYCEVVVVKGADQGELASLSSSINALLSRVQQSIVAANESEAYAKELANYDELTGLANRRLLVERMEYILEIASRENKHGALLFIDLDNFKTLNDSRGHAAGDELLKQVAVSLKKFFRNEDTVARLGGDEFVILSGRLEETEDAVINQVHSLMQKLRGILSESFTVQDEVYHLTASVGISTFPHLANTPSELLKRADTAMYRAKEAGRDAYRFYRPEMQAAADARLQMENDLRQAINSDEFELFYQPQVDEFGRALGAEALLRWFKAEVMISPADFIPVAELTGLILPIGDWVLKNSFLQLKRWLEEGVDPSFTLSINISPLQFHQETFVVNIEGLLKETGLPAKNITLEITEGIAIEDIQATIDKMHVLKNIGFKVSMDDFGTGYSSLTYLKKLPLNELKIDQSFVRDLDVDKEDAELVETIIAMAKNLHLEVVAEGVETESQLRFLCRNDCTVFQGYYFHKPMRATELTELLSGNLIIL